MYLRCFFLPLLTIFTSIGLGCSCETPLDIGDTSKLTTDQPNHRLFFVRADPTANVEKSFLLYNQGTTPLVLKSASITGDTTSSFTFVEPPAFPLTLAPGKDNGLSFKIKHMPANLNNQVARIAFGYATQAINIASILYVELQAQIPRGQLQFSCGVLAFGKVKHGKQKTESCLIRNIGEKTLTINAILFDGKKTAAKEFRLKEVAFPLVLASGEDYTFFVTYAPQDNEDTEDVGRFVLESDVLLEPGQARPSFEVRGTTLVSLLEIVPQFENCEADHDCNWLDPRLRCKPFLLEATRRCQPSDGTSQAVPWLKFPYVPSGGTVERAFVLRSSGTLPVTITKLQLTDGKASLFRLGKVSLPITLQPHEERLVAVSLVGPVVAQESAEIGIQSDAANAAQLRLALLVDAPACQLRVVAPFWAKGAINAGTTDPGQPVETPISLHNAGGLRCNVTAISLSPVGETPASALTFAEKPDRTALLEPGEAWSAKIRFAPDASARVFLATLAIASDAKDQHVIELSAQGNTDTRCLQAVPEKLDFGLVENLCNAKEANIQLVNRGGPDCRDVKIEKISLDAGSSSAFQIFKAPRGAIAEGQDPSGVITIRYRPQGQVADRAVLVVETSQGNKGRLSIPIFGAGGQPIEQTDTFRQLKKPKTDILFVIDNRSGMKEEQSSLSKNFQAFAHWFVRLNVDYQVMVTTTDVSGKDAPAGCARGQIKIIDNATPDPAQAFLYNTLVGTSGSGKGQGLEAAYQALSPKMLNDPNCNKGFLRTGASLLIVFVSDTDDQSPSDVGWYVNWFKSLKGTRHLDLLRASAVVGLPPDGCHIPGQSSASSAPRYVEFSKQLKGTQESICNTIWASTLSNNGTITIGYRTQYFLSKLALSGTVRVKVNGQQIKEDPKEGWSYDAVNNSIQFHYPGIPPADAIIEVKYQVRCPPP